MNSNATVYIAFLGTFWGTNLVASRFGIQQFDPILFVGLRLLLASVGMVVILWLSPSHHWPKDGRIWRRAALLGIVSTAIPTTMIVSSMQYQSSGVTSIFITVAPAIIVLMAHFALPDERLTRYKLMGVALALSGALLLVIRGENGLVGIAEATGLGFGMVMVALLCEAMGAVFIRKYMQGFDAVQVTAVRLSTAALVVLPFAIIWRGVDFSQVTNEGIFSLGYAAFIGMLLAQLTAFYLTRRFGATVFSLAAYVIPVAALVTGVLFLGERVTGGMMVGMLLIAIGITLINRQTGA